MPRYKAPVQTEPPQLTVAQLQAVELLAQGQLAGAVAQAVGVTPTEIGQWRRSAIFIAAVNTQLQDARETTRQRLRGLADQALTAVELVVTDDATPAQLRLQAALKVLDLVGAGDAAKEKIGGITVDEVRAEQRRAEYDRGLY